jgi:arginyl-tRNA synthetase
MQNPAEKIYSILYKFTKEEMGLTPFFKIEKPKESSHGDFSSNIALVLAKKTRNNSFELAKNIVKKIEKDKDFEKIEAVKPGFINFYLSKKYLQSQLQNIISQGQDYGSSVLGKGKKASVEFVSANPTGPLHIGNARGGPLGDTIANVLAKVGFKVTREYLHNDVGGQVERLGEAIYFELNPEQKGANYVPIYQGKYLKELAKKVEEELQDKSMDISDRQFIQQIGKTAVEIMLIEIIKDCEAMGIKFDKITKESNLRKKVPQALSKLKKYLKEKEGAIWFAPNDEFLKDRETVVKKSDGSYTYFASDIVYHQLKLSQNDIVIDVLGANHSGHVPKLLAIEKALNPNSNKLKIVLYQYVMLKRGKEILKMSKRAGNFVTTREVLEEVGKDAFRFFLLMQNANTHLDFDLSLAKKKASDNPVFYVQYAYARIASIFAKVKNLSLKVQHSELLKENEEIDLIRKLTEFPQLVEDISKNLQVNLLANYAIDLASLFHKFYERHQVISENKALSLARLSLLKATQITLKNTLDLLGVSALEKM